MRRYYNRAPPPLSREKKKIFPQPGPGPISACVMPRRLDALLNARSAEGWELVTYDYMATSTQVKGAFIITFRREQ